jgi:DME family drug/metabolite transporter
MCTMSESGTNRNGDLVGRAKLALAALLFSTGGAAIKALPFSGFTVAALRSTVAAIAIFLLLPAARSWRHHSPLRLLLVGAAYATTMILFVLANKLTTSANTIFLQSTAPIYLALLAPLVLKEKVARADLVFMGALAFGLALFFVGQEAPRVSAPDPVLGNTLAAIAGVSWALTLLGLRSLARPGAKAAGSAAAAAIGAGNVLAMLVTMPLAWPLPELDAASVAIVVYLGVFQIGLAYVVLTRGLARVPALEASLLLLLEPVLNPVFAYAFHGEAPTGFALLGCVVIFASTVLRSLAGGAK